MCATNYHSILTWISVSRYCRITANRVWSRFSINCNKKKKKEHNGRDFVLLRAWVQYFLMFRFLSTSTIRFCLLSFFSLHGVLQYSFLHQSQSSCYSRFCNEVLHEIRKTASFSWSSHHSSLLSSLWFVCFEDPSSSSSSSFSSLLDLVVLEPDSSNNS